jgi:hypothetical protein
LDRGARTGFLGLQALAWAWAAFAYLPRQAAWIDGGVIFAAWIGLVGWGLAAGGAFVRGSLRGLSWPVLVLGPVVPWLFFHGAQGAAGGAVGAFTAVPSFVAGTLLWALLAAPETGPDGEGLPDWGKAALLFAAGLALGAAVWSMRSWMQLNLMWPEDKSSIWMIMMRRFNGGATDIIGATFTQWAWLWVAGAWAAGLGALLWMAPRLQEESLLWSLFAAAMLGKLALAGLSSAGIHIVADKIASVNTNFFSISKLIDQEGVLHFLKTFNSRQSGLGFHADTHPPLPLLIYWTLRRAFFDSTWGAALGIMALNAAAVFPWYHLGKRLGGATAGLAAAALYLSSPLNLILGNAGIDSVASSAVGFAAYCIVAALQDDDAKRAFQGGLFLALAANCSFAANAALVFLGTWGLLLAWRARSDAMQFLLRSLQVWGLVTLGMLAVHGAFFALSGGDFSYMAAVRSAQFAHMQANLFRTYELWSWANCLIYAGYAGLGLLVLWLGCLASSLWNADTRDAAVIAGGAFVLTVVLAAFGRAEIQRQFLFGLVALIPAACLPARKGWILTAAIALNVINAVFLQANVLDYW